jgi:hypothetical protein
MNLDLKWTSVDAKQMPSGKRLVIKMAGKNNEISLAIGLVQNGELVFTARENPAATLAIYWVALPD